MSEFKRIEPSEVPGLFKALGVVPVQLDRLHKPQPPNSCCILQLLGKLPNGCSEFNTHYECGLLSAWEGREKWDHPTDKYLAGHADGTAAREALIREGMMTA
jgi:hypothetical protein